MENDPVIAVRDVVKEFGGRRVLDGVTLEVYRGETFVIMGGSGCGKSTLLRIMIGAMPPDSGQAFLFGKEISALGPEELERLRLRFGMLFQSGALFDSMTVGENIRLPLREHSELAESTLDILVKMKLELVGLRGFENLMPAQLSGGMRKRVGLARAIAVDPEIVFYDEPTAGLDPVMTGVIDKLIVDLSQKLEITSVVVTHDMGSVFRIARRVAMLHQGRVVQVGTVEEIRQSQNAIVRQFVEGSPDGPVSFLMAGEGYLEQLTA